MKKVFIQHWPFVIFTILVGFFSGFGQTYCLALFNDVISELTGLKLNSIAKVYGFATLGAAFLVPVSGYLIDRYPLKVIISIIGIGLYGSFFLLGIANNIYLLFVAYLFIRFLGQSSLPMVGDTAVSKYFGQYRGKLLGFKNLGKSLGEGFIALLVIYCLSQTDFKFTSHLIGLGFLVLLIPFSFLLLKNFKEKVHYDEKEHVKKVRKKYDFFTAIKEPRFMILVLGNLALGFVLTGVFFHFKFLINYQNWSKELWAGSFIFYSISQLIFTFITGFYVDKKGSFTFFYYKFVPLIIGFIILLLFKSKFACVLMFISFGISVGMANATGTSLYAELFGEKFLGKVGGVSWAIVVVSTAIAPSLFNFLLENYGVKLTLCLIIGYLIFSSFLLRYSIHLYKKEKK